MPVASIALRAVAFGTSTSFNGLPIATANFWTASA